jgi:cysteine-rich repeat protein
MLTITAASDDTWSAGADDRTSNANGLIEGNIYGGNYGLYGAFPYGALVARIDGGDWFLVGTNYNGIVAEAGTLEFAYWDSNNGDNTDSVAITISVKSPVECYVPSCGNGYIDEGEECDPGMYYKVQEEVVNEGYCNEVCEWVPSSYCGDGILDQQAGEVCDDGNNNNGDGCTSTCGGEENGGGNMNGGGGNEPNELLETGPEDGNEPTPATSESVHEACDEDTYILDRLSKLSQQPMEIVYAIPSSYALQLGTKALRFTTQLTALLRGTTDDEARNDLIRDFVCKIEILKAKRGLRHENIGADSGGSALDYLLQYLQDLAILQFTR